MKKERRSTNGDSSVVDDIEKDIRSSISKAVKKITRLKGSRGVTGLVRRLTRAKGQKRDDVQMMDTEEEDVNERGSPLMKHSKFEEH
tara:strand:+ start:2095 stop:2355 length:261 start_codon:yes stop_codon:yes gene_type:complete